MQSLNRAPRFFVHPQRGEKKSKTMVGEMIFRLPFARQIFYASFNAKTLIKQDVRAPVTGRLVVDNTRCEFPFGGHVFGAAVSFTSYFSQGKESKE